MMANEKVFCPYCGPWNDHPDGVEMKLKDVPGLDVFWMECPVCRNGSPVKATPEAAIEAAKRRFTPMQRPMLED